jgi:arylsulfatase A-like enzyme
MRLSRLIASAAVVGAGLLAPMVPAVAQDAAAAKPNILVIFGDDIGQTNISAYADGVVGYRTPNIDRIAKEGMKFTDYYAENSCTAGRSSFITGQTPLRTGLTKVGVPRRTGRPAGTRHHHRRGAEAARLRDRPVRQEPSWRQG